MSMKEIAQDTRELADQLKPKQDTLYDLCQSMINDLGEKDHDFARELRRILRPENARECLNELHHYKKKPRDKPAPIHITIPAAIGIVVAFALIISAACPAIGYTTGSILAGIFIPLFIFAYKTNFTITLTTPGSEYNMMRLDLLEVDEPTSEEEPPSDTDSTELD